MVAGSPLTPAVCEVIDRIDQVSSGRVVVGLGLGWSVDEFEAVGVPIPHRGARIEEILDVLGAMATTDCTGLAPFDSRAVVRSVERPRGVWFRR